MNKHAGVSEKVDSRRQELPHKEVTKHQPVIHKYKYRSADIENTNVNANINHPNIDDLYTYKYTKKD